MAMEDLSIQDPLFDAMKILVCGDGAMLHFRDPELREKADKWMYFGLEASYTYHKEHRQNVKEELPLFWE